MFIDEHTIVLKSKTGKTEKRMTAKLYDTINSTSKLSPVIGCSFGGFKRLASSNLKDKLKELEKTNIVVESDPSGKKMFRGPGEPNKP
jgi:hypothetical protein